MTLGKSLHPSTEKWGRCKAGWNGIQSGQAKPQSPACGRWEKGGTLLACPPIASRMLRTILAHSRWLSRYFWHECMSS